MIMIINIGEENKDQVWEIKDQLMRIGFVVSFFDSIYVIYLFKLNFLYEN